MLSTKYHFVSIAAIFLALGIGILIGGTLGQGWMREAEQDVVAHLEAQVTEQSLANEELRKQLDSLQLMVQRLNPVQLDKIVWVRSEEEQPALLSFLLEVLGADRFETYSLQEDGVSWLSKRYDGQRIEQVQRNADLILTADATVYDAVKQALTGLLPANSQDHPFIINISEYFEDWDDPEALVSFILNLNDYGMDIGGKEHAIIHLDRNSSSQ